MSLIDEVKQMQSQGMQNEQIVTTLRERGLQYKDIAEVLSQTRIKAAVEGFSDSMSEMQPSMSAQNSQNFEDIQAPSPMPENENPYTPSYPQNNEFSQDPNPPQDYSPQFQEQQYSPSQQQYSETQPYQQEFQNYSPDAGISSDTITEITEQVVMEKLSGLRKNLDKVIDFRTTIDAKIESVDERLKRIERVIDTLQNSVLKRVGDYMLNVDDLKKELIETQKSFSKISNTHKTHTGHHTQGHHHEEHKGKKHK